MFFIHLSAHNAEKVYLCNMICSTFAWLWFLILALRFSFSPSFSPPSCVLALALRFGFGPPSLFDVVFTTSLPIPPQALVELSMLIIPINI